MMHMNDYESQLLSGWEDAYKKGQVTLLILLALREGPKHMADIKQFISDVTIQRMSIDDKSMYRALRRHNDVEMVEYVQKPGNGGPERKVYRLTATGVVVLQNFIQRNITELYDQPQIQSLIKENK